MNRAGSLNLWFYTRCPCPASVAAQVTQVRRRFKLEHVHSVLNKNLSVVRQTDYHCKQSSSNLEVNSHCQAVSYQQVLLPELIFLCPWSMCVHCCFFEVLHAPTARVCCTLGKNPRLAAGSFATSLEDAHSGMLLIAKCCLVLFREEISGREAGFCWLVNQISMRLHRNLGQLMPTCDSKPVQHMLSWDVSQASMPYQPTAFRCSALS